MRIIVEKDYESMSRRAAIEFASYLTQAGRVNVAPTAGTTPKRLYELLAEMIVGTSIEGNSSIHYYQQDEVLSSKDTNSRAISNEIEELFFKKTKISLEQFHVLQLDSIEQRDDEIEAAGGLDLVLMGLGGDGHIAANMPHTPFANKGYSVALPETVTEMLKKEYPGLSNTPDTMLSLGMSTLMKAKNLLLVVTGEKKAEILKQAIEGPITEEVQASILRLHPNLTIICDEGAASLLADNR